MNATIKALLLKAIQPRKVKYTLIHESSKEAITSNGKNYKIVCSQAVKLPLSKKEIMELSDDQAKLLETILKYRKIEKAMVKYEKLTQPKNQLNQ